MACAAGYVRGLTVLIGCAPVQEAPLQATGPGCAPRRFKPHWRVVNASVSWRCDRDGMTEGLVAVATSGPVVGDLLASTLRWRAGTPIGHRTVRNGEDGCEELTFGNCSSKPCSGHPRSYVNCAQTHCQGESRGFESRRPLQVGGGRGPPRWRVPLACLPGGPCGDRLGRSCDGSARRTTSMDSSPRTRRPASSVRHPSCATCSARSNPWTVNASPSSTPAGAPDPRQPPTHDRRRYDRRVTRCRARGRRGVNSCARPTRTSRAGRVAAGGRWLHHFELAKLLGSSLRSVESSRARLRRTLGVRTRAELVRYALDTFADRPADLILAAFTNNRLTERDRVQSNAHLSAQQG